MATSLKEGIRFLPLLWKRIWSSQKGYFKVRGGWSPDQAKVNLVNCEKGQRHSHEHGSPHTKAAVGR